ncbi:MAG: hypothetical protein L6V93_00675 [Clostridiales bacterium]|nr:MAG: hypothetical protein L6V93_00675 [Clostridiales bacterium]
MKNLRKKYDALLKPEISATSFIDVVLTLESIVFLQIVCADSECTDA